MFFNNRFNSQDRLLQEHANKINILNIDVSELKVHMNILLGNRVGDNKSILNDLLIKIAKLEGIKDAVENRRTSNELLSKLDELNTLLLKNDMEGMDISILTSQISILKWVLGE